MGGILIFSKIPFSSEAADILYDVSTYFDLYWKGIQWFYGDGDGREVTRDLLFF